jgi:4-hydroxy-3-polyprenylbenzoate decarboxylase
MQNLPLIVGITGASGVIFGVRTLEVLKNFGVEAHLIMSEAAKINLGLETDYAPEDIYRMAAKVYEPDDMAASVASGSFLTRGMIIAPCTMKTLSAIANSFGHNLLARAADVCLKERRTLVLLVRETPLHSGHLGLMAKAASMGAVILPPIPAFYHHPKTIQDLIDQIVGKTLDCFHIDHRLFQRWH